MMASSAAKVVQAVKAHVPLIKFPKRKALNGKNMESVFKDSGNISASSASSSTSSTSKPVGSTPRGSGIDHTDLPSRYHRKPLSNEEMEAIELGGSH